MHLQSDFASEIEHCLRKDAHLQNDFAVTELTPEASGYLHIQRVDVMMSGIVCVSLSFGACVVIDDEYCKCR